jgi:Leucine-rich repeat (LRR) protein
MTKQFSRGVPGARRSKYRARAWSNMPLSAIVFVLATFVALSGCDKPPTFSELINGKKKEEPPPAAPQVAKTSTPAPPPRQEPPKEPEKPKRAPQEAIAEFNATPPVKRTNQQLIELAGSPEATDQFTELALGSSGVSDAGLAVLPKFDKVEKLAIDGCQYTNNALANIAKMKSLTSLSMNGGSVADPSHNCDSGLAAIKEMHQLTSLSIDSANLTPKGLAHVASMTWLESLNVAHTRFNDDNLEMLAPLVNLKALNISFTNVSDNGFRLLLPFHQMESLNISRLPIVGDGLRGLAQSKAMPNLHELTMHSINALDLSGYQGIFGFKKTLQSLDVGMSKLTDDRFVDAIVPCTKLEVLMVHENPSLGDGGISQIGKLRNLKRLFFYKNPGVTDASIKSLAKLRKLESITINASGVTLAGAQHLKKMLKNCDVVFNDRRIE